MRQSKLNEEIKQHGLDKLKDGIGIDCYAAELHHHLYNEDYFIIGVYAAKKAMGDCAFNIIGEVQAYEQDNFGECTTDLSCPERVLNMYAYIKGEEFLSESTTLQERWDSILDEDAIAQIIEEIEEA